MFRGQVRKRKGSKAGGHEQLAWGLVMCLIPHAYFGWSERKPVTYLLKYLIFGEGETAPVTRGVLRQAEDDPERRPSIHVGG